MDVFDDTLHPNEKEFGSLETSIKSLQMDCLGLGTIVYFPNTPYVADEDEIDNNQDSNNS